MFDDMQFKLPDTAVAAYKRTPSLPSWSAIQTDISIADQLIDAVESDENWQARMRNYFGMVKLIDDKVGEVLSFLKESGAEENTVVVFTRCANIQHDS